jgi:hypothetical protein
MRTATISKALAIGVILSMLVAGPVFAQGTSGAAPRDEVQTGGTDQPLPFYLTPQGTSTPDMDVNAAMGAIMNSVPTVPVAPEQLPVTGQQQDPYLKLLEQYRQMYGGSGGSAAPAQLPETGAAEGTTLGELFPEEIVGVMADLVSESMVPAPPAGLPETGAVAPTASPQETATVQLPERMIGPQPSPVPEALPATGQRSDPYSY